MSHDRIRQAARERMARTGESYADARRRVMAEHNAEGHQAADDPWFAMSYREAGLDRITAWMDTLLGAGPGRAGITVGRETISVRAGDFKQDVPRSMIQDARRSFENIHGTTGVHHSRGRWLINGGPDGLVEMTIAPGFRMRPQFSSQFLPGRVERLIVSLIDPEGFIAALGFGEMTGTSRNP